MYKEEGTMLRNQNGVAGVMTVLVISFTIVTTLSTVYVYLVNRSKYHGRIRQAYQMNQVMEEFGKSIRQAYDSAQNGGGCAANNLWPSATATPRFCFPNGEPGDLKISHLGEEYQVIGFQDINGNEGVTGASYRDERMHKKKNLWANWANRLEKHYREKVSKDIEYIVSRGIPFLNLEQNPGIFNTVYASFCTANCGSTRGEDDKFRVSEDYHHPGYQEYEEERNENQEQTRNPNGDSWVEKKQEEDNSDGEKVTVEEETQATQPPVVIDSSNDETCKGSDCQVLYPPEEIPSEKNGECGPDNATAPSCMAICESSSSRQNKPEWCPEPLNPKNFVVQMAIPECGVGADGNRLCETCDASAGTACYTITACASSTRPCPASQIFSAPIKVVEEL